MLLLLVIALGVLFFLTRWAYRKGKAEWDKYNGIEGWFAKIVQNEIYAVTSGRNGKIRFFFGEMSYADIDSKTGELLPKGTVTLNPIDALIRKEYNRVFIGPPYEPWARQTKKLAIDRVTLKSTEKILGIPGQYLSDKLLAETKTEGGLYGRFTRIQLAPEIDLGSNFRVEIMTTAFCEVITAMPIFEVHSKDFLQITSQIINAYIDALVRTAKWEEFKTKIGSALGDNDIININKLLERVGIRVSQIILDDWGISRSSADIQEQLANLEKAEIRAKVTETDTAAEVAARTKKADLKLYEQKKEGEGARLILQETAKGRAATVKALIKGYMEQGVTGPEAARFANAEILNESKYPNLKGLKTLVEDKAAGVIISPGGKDE